jgi:hypothetical protein
MRVSDDLIDPFVRFFLNVFYLFNKFLICVAV